VIDALILSVKTLRTRKRGEISPFELDWGSSQFLHAGQLDCGMRAVRLGHREKVTGILSFVGTGRRNSKNCHYFRSMTETVFWS